MHYQHNFETASRNAYDGDAHGDSTITGKIAALINSEGSAVHHHVRLLISLAADRTVQPNAPLADAAHYLCLMHGHFPGIMDHAANHCADNVARRWLIEACEGFARERAYIARLSVELGPVPSTRGHAGSDSIVLQLRHALDMLAQSDRHGCAIGAAVTLALDWRGVRRLMDHAAIRIGLDPIKCILPDDEDSRKVLRGIAGDEASERAIIFGARQLLRQHHSLWDLLDDRALARSAETARLSGKISGGSHSA
ncbi:MAG: hypothetical protein E2598_07145 [Sphingobium sp.]|nr:hypothetical protein [Sphingobium sp.]